MSKYNETRRKALQSFSVDMMMVGGRCEYWWLRAVELSIFITAHEDDTMILIKTSPIKHE